MNKKDHYFDHPADIGVASLANTHFKWKKVSEVFITICRSRYSSFQQFIAGTKTILGLIRAKLTTPISTDESQVKHQKYLYFLFSFLLRI